MAKILDTRIQHKHDTEANWLLATDFIPLQSELIVYDADENYDYQRFKIGDGSRTISELPFSFATTAALANKANTSDVLTKAAQTLTDAELTQVRANLKFIGKDVEGQQFTIDGTTVTASPNAEIFGDYTSNIAVGQWSIAEGSGTVAKGRASHAEGAMTQALADGTHTEGYGTKATGYYSHAEGEMTVVTSYASHAEGSYCTMPDGSKRYTTASGYASHSEGGGCHTTGSCAHAEGLGSLASGNQAHVEGRYTIAAGSAQHVEGVANIEDTNNQYIHIAGNGTLPTDRSNAYTLDWNGNGEYAGDVIANGHASGEPISLTDIGGRTTALEAAMQEVSEEEFLAWLNEEKVIEPVTDASGAIYVTNNNEYFIL